MIGISIQNDINKQRERFVDLSGIGAALPENTGASFLRCGD